MAASGTEGAGESTVEAPAPAEEVAVADTGAEAPAKASVEAPAPAEEVMVADVGAEAKGRRRRVVAPSLATLEAAMRKLGQEITNAQANSQPATAASELAHWLEEQGHECSPCYHEAVTRRSRSSSKVSSSGLKSRML